MEAYLTTLVLHYKDEGKKFIRQIQILAIIT